MLYKIYFIKYYFLSTLSGEGLHQTLLDGEKHHMLCLFKVTRRAEVKIFPHIFQGQQKFLWVLINAEVEFFDVPFHGYIFYIWGAKFFEVPIKVNRTRFGKFCRLQNGRQNEKMTEKFPISLIILRQIVNCPWTIRFFVKKMSVSSISLGRLSRNWRLLPRG